MISLFLATRDLEWSRMYEATISFLMSFTRCIVVRFLNPLALRCKWVGEPDRVDELALMICTRIDQAAVANFEYNLIIHFISIIYLHFYHLHTCTCMYTSFNNNQAAVANLKYNPIIHDLALEPRALSAEEAVDTWLDMYVGIMSIFTSKISEYALT